MFFPNLNLKALLPGIKVIMSTNRRAEAISATSDTVPQTSDIVSHVGDNGTAASDVVSLECFSTFTSFPRLPLELRLAIWRFAAFEPRNVEVCTSNYCNRPSAPTYRDGSPRLLPHFFSTCPIPGLLHANQESREEGLKHFQAEFGNLVQLGGELWRVDPPTFTFEPRIYVNWKVDRICLMNYSIHQNLLADFLTKAEEREVESMAICVASAESTLKARGVIHPDNGSVHLQWIRGVEELQHVMNHFPFHDSLQEIILFNHPFDHKLRLVSQGLKTTIGFGLFDYERETTAEMYNKDRIIDYIGASVDSNRDWRFTAYDDDEHVAEEIPGIDELESKDADADPHDEDYSSRLFVERTLSVKLRQIIIED